MAKRFAGQHRGKHPSGYHRNSHAIEAWDRGATEAQVEGVVTPFTHCPTCTKAYYDGWEAGKAEVNAEGSSLEG